MTKSLEGLTHPNWPGPDTWGYSLGYSCKDLFGPHPPAVHVRWTTLSGFEDSVGAGTMYGYCGA